MPRRARPPKAVLQERASMLPPAEDAALQATYQSFVDNTYLTGILGFDRRVDAFLRQPFAVRIGREKARAIVKGCCEQYARETAEARSGAVEAAVRTLADGSARAMQIYATATRTVFVRRTVFVKHPVVKGEPPKVTREETVTREEVPDQRTRLRALEARSRFAVDLCRLLGLDAPEKVEVVLPYDEALVRAAQETRDEDYLDMARPRQLGRGGVVDAELVEDDGELGDGKVKH